MNSSAGVINIGDDAVAQNINIGSGASARTITIGNDASTKLGASAILMDVSAGTGGFRLDSTATGNDAINMVASAGGMTMRVADEKDLTLGNAALDAYVKIAASSNASLEDIRIINTNGTDAKAIDIEASAGGINITSSPSTGKFIVMTGDVSMNNRLYVAQNALFDKDVTIEGNLNVQQYQSENIINTTTSNYQLIVSEDLSLNGRLFVDFDASFGGSIGMNADGVKITMGEDNDTVIQHDGTTGLDFDTVGTLSINSSAGAINIGNDAVAQNMNIGTGAAARAISIGNATGATELDLDAGTGGVSITSTRLDDSAITLTSTSGGITMKVADENNLTLGNADLDAYFQIAASTTNGNEDVRIVNTNGTDEAAIAITVSGGVDIDAAPGRDVHISGGQVTVVSKTNESNAISLTTDQGSSETIAITNTQGTDNSAIALTAGSGGITMKVADEKDLTLGNAALDAYVKVAASATVGNEDIRIVNTNGSDDAAIEINAASGGIAMTAKNSTFNMTTLGSAVLTTNSTILKLH